MRTRAQSSVEFALVVTIVGIVFSVFIIFFNVRIVEVQQQQNYALLEDVGKIIKSEVDLASVVEDGYVRSFYLPSDLSGLDYEISYKNGQDLGAKYSYAVVEFTEEDISTGEYLFFLTPNLTGNFGKGTENFLVKENGGVVVSAPEANIALEISPQYQTVFFNDVATLELSGNLENIAVESDNSDCIITQNVEIVSVKLNGATLGECLITATSPLETVSANVNFAGFFIEPDYAHANVGDRLIFGLDLIPYTGEIVWSVDGNACTFEEIDGDSIEVEAIEMGDCHIKAKYIGTGYEAIANLIVEDNNPTSLYLSPADFNLLVGESREYTVSGGSGNYNAYIEGSGCVLDITPPNSGRILGTKITTGADYCNLIVKDSNNPVNILTQTITINHNPDALEIVKQQVDGTIPLQTYFTDELFDAGCSDGYRALVGSVGIELGASLWPLQFSTVYVNAEGNLLNTSNEVGWFDTTQSHVFYNPIDSGTAEVVTNLNKFGEELSGCVSPSIIASTGAPLSEQWGWINYASTASCSSTSFAYYCVEQTPN